MRALLCVARLAISRPILIIPLNVGFLYLSRFDDVAEPRLASIVEFDIGKAWRGDRRIVIDEDLAETGKGESPTVDDLSRRSPERALPGIENLIRCRVFEGGIPLSEGSTIGAELVVDSWFDEKGKTVKEGPPYARLAGDQLVVRGRHGN
jgi:hypothetical protein